MGSRCLLSWLSVCFLVLSGCLWRQVAADGRSFRQALLDMYTDQVMDNLIRAAEAQPFVQIAYRNLIVTDTQIAKVNFSDESDPMVTKTFLVSTGAVITTMRSYTNKLVFGGSLETDRQMQFKADPVVGKTDVFDYYLAFARDPALFWVTECEPSGPVHIKKRLGCKWYSVPCEASGVFLQLCLKTTFMRGPEPPPAIYWETSVKGVNPRYGKQGKRTDGWHVIIVSDPVPNDEGALTISLGDGRQVSLGIEKMSFEPYQKGLNDQPQVPLSPSEKTTITRLYAYDQAQPVLYPEDHNSPTGIPAEQLTNRPAKFLAKNHPNLGPKPLSPDGQRLADALANYRKSVVKNP